MTWARSAMRDGVLSSTSVFSALDAFAPRGDVLELAYGTGEWTIRLAESATRVVGVDAAPEMRELALAKLHDAGKSNVELGWTISSAGSQIKTMTWSSLRSGCRTFPRAMPTGSGVAFTTRFAPEAASSSWMPDARSWRGTSFTVRDCPIARARLSLGDSRTVGSFGLSSVRSILTGSREIFVNTALTRALSRQASSSSTDSADVPSPT